ncbi:MULTISPECIES: response regulator transcription factor [Oceanotoga]|jgi:two-component system response regulator CssR|uniref:Two-component system response regulator CssR n=1 Tax=Oceanotoga teriensis TaxID=515440 RepID=A0AA45C7W8_9BACT|nr:MULTISPECIES: response regulator transcription factor [Oceanotoga]MDN5341276.1 two-component system, OmpR family, response regulator CssR [Oceanotoga sp.]MDO7976997.1 response regulator transcription factor [Oceanotoga teriensis]PWJ95701.1 two-component system response regulator CssR [Oceanotoga teriensis]
MNYKIYLLEDEENLNTILKSYLEKEGWEVKSFLKGFDAEKYIEDKPDLWILDIMLPDTDGFEFIKKIKNFDNTTPVIFISARDTQIDRVVGLDMGSDDYLSKPFMPRELIIRAKNLLNRVYGHSLVDKIIDLGNIKIDPLKRIIIDSGVEIELTSKEFDMVYYLSKNAGNAFSREKLLDEIWGKDYFGSDRVVDDLIRRLRKKVINLNIESIYGYGYRVSKS